MLFGYEVKDWIEAGFAALGFKSFTEIQQKTIPALLKNKNIIGVSATGTGKTLAFLIPALNKLDLQVNTCQLLILVPTRELARQTQQHLVHFKKFQSQLTVQTLTGGQEYEKQIAKFNNHPPHVLIATPTRLHEALMNKQIKYQNLQNVILDEADMLMDLGFNKQLEQIFEIIDHAHLQKSGWSATLHDLLSGKLAKFFKDTKVIQVGNSIYDNSQIEHFLIHTQDKEKTLSTFAKTKKPYLCIVFCNTKKQIDNLVKVLKLAGVSVIALHGNLDARKRRNTYRDIKLFKYQYIVASDLASRGLDIDGVSHIISWELPESLEWYIHRAGRAGRGKYQGESYTIFNEQQIPELLSLEKKGICFKHLKQKKDEFIVQDYKMRVRKFKLDDELNRQIRNIATKPQKVKPGYKRKQQQEIFKLKQKSKRKYLEKKIKQERIKQYKQKNFKANSDF